jgi:hypothetical protein
VLVDPAEQQPVNDRRIRKRLPADHPAAAALDLESDERDQDREWLPRAPGSEHRRFS